MPRNSAGSWSAPTGNPVVSGTSVASTWANALVGDVGTELGDSLSRSGKGPMLAPMRVPDGTVAAPTVAFSSETGSGLYRAGSSDVRMSLAGTDRAKWTAAGFFADVITALTATSATVKGAVADGADAVAVVFDSAIELVTPGAKIASFRNAGTEKASVDLAGKGSFVGLDAGSQKITAVLDPTGAQDAATKAYADGASVTVTPGAGFSISATEHACHKAGRMVVMHLSMTAGGGSAWTAIGTLPAGARPATQTHGIGWVLDSSTLTSYLARFTISTSGVISAEAYDNGTSLVLGLFAIGSGDGASLAISFVAA